MLPYFRLLCLGLLLWGGQNSLQYYLERSVWSENVLNARQMAAWLKTYTSEHLPQNIYLSQNFYFMRLVDAALGDRVNYVWNTDLVKKVAVEADLIVVDANTNFGGFFAQTLAEDVQKDFGKIYGIGSYAIFERKPGTKSNAAKQAPKTTLFYL